MRNKAAALWIFQQKILAGALIPSALMGCLGLAQNEWLLWTGVSYLFFAPLAHYAVYEVVRPAEYHFYYNLGLGRRELWCATVLSGICVYLIAALL